MAPTARTDQIEEIRVRSDIVDVIQRYVPLKKAGRQFKACCPFHKEKTPSFQVNPDKQLYYCFGCGAGGDVFKFVMQYENVEFLEAARILADRAGLPFEPRSSEGGGPATPRTDLYRLHEQLAAWYHANLKEAAAAEKARQYLTERDLTSAIEPFQLGYAPPQAKALERWADAQQIPRPLLEQAGVLLPSDRGGAPFDRFRGRLMFPIRNEQGRIVGFSGRILDASSPAKYVNSPETPLFKKSRLLYGLDRARQTMTDTRRALICEGQIDVIRCQLAGLENTAAPQGTSLTEGHAALLKRYADEIVLVFDADHAGRSAALRAAEPLLGENLTVRVVTLPMGEDPDSLIRSQGRDALASLLNDAPDLVTFQVAGLREQGELNHAAGRTRAVRAILETIRYAPSAVQREDYCRIAAAQIGVSEEALRRDMWQQERPGPKRATPPAPPHMSTAGDFPPQETKLIELMLAHPEVIDLVHQYVPPQAITHPACRTLMEVIMTAPDPHELNIAAQLTTHDEAIQRLAVRLQMEARPITGDEFTCLHAAQDLIFNLRIRQLARRIQRCRKNLTEATGTAARELENERAQLFTLRKRLEALWIERKWDEAVPILEWDD